MAEPTGTLLDDTFTRKVSPGSLGTADDGHTYGLVNRGHWSVNGTRAIADMSITTTNNCIADPNTATCLQTDEWLEFTIPTAPGASGDLVNVELRSRFQNENTYYFARATQYGDNSLRTCVGMCVSGTVTILQAAVVSEAAMSPSAVYVLRFKTTGAGKPRLQAVAFLKSGGQPATWDRDFTETANSNSTAGRVSCKVSVQATNVSTPKVQIATWLADNLDAGTGPPNAPTLALSGVTGGHTSSSSTDATFSSTTPPAVDHYEFSTDNGHTFNALTSPQTISLSVGQTVGVAVYAVGTDGQVSATVTANVTRGGTTTNVYTPQLGDVGAQIRCRVAASDAQGTSDPVASAWSIPVVAAPTIPSNTTPPTVSGGTPVGSTLVCSPGAWDDQSATFQYQWRNNGVSLGSSARDASYVTQSTDASDVIDCEVKATNSAGTSSYIVSSNSITVDSTPQPPTNTNPPDINLGANNPPQVGDELGVIQGQWAGAQPITLTHQWLRGQPGSMVAIDGETDNSYTVSKDDVGQYIGLQETAMNAYGVMRRRTKRHKVR